MIDSGGCRPYSNQNRRQGGTIDGDAFGAKVNGGDSTTGLLHSCYAAAIAAAQPAAALRAPLRAARRDRSPFWVISVGKAAPGMAAAITENLVAEGRQLAGGVVIGPPPDARGSASAWTTGVWPSGQSHAALRFVDGDHPIPRADSARAAEAIGDIVRRIPDGADVHVAISGGASALIAGPLPDLTMPDITLTFELLLASGLDIHEMNAVRKRITRWSGGRLGVALAGRIVHVWVISDVPGDDVASIASGPCTGDPWTADEVRSLLAHSRLAEQLPVAVRTAMARETPKPGDPRLAGIAPLIVANNRTALAAAAAQGRQSGIAVRVMDDPLVGEASEMGRRIAATMHGIAETEPQLLLWGGETTVTIGDGPHGTGGRAQELALSAAQSLHDTRAAGILLVAGTDGRDGPTDAAGALVNRDTWQRIVAAGRDPAVDLSRHDGYPALDAAGALVRTGPSGTNVMDLALAITGAR
jgi:glycerate-2-kinase